MLRIFLSAVLLAAGVGVAEAATVTCEDGRVMTPTPFNPNPCGTLAPPTNPTTPTTPPPPTTPEPTTTTTTTPTTPTSGTVTCSDGRVLLPTPFNPNPCGTATPPAPPTTPGPTPTTPAPTQPSSPVAGSEVPDDFLLAFGPEPEPTGFAFEDAIAKAAYEAQFMRFVGLGFEPERYAEVAAVYSRWGFGAPTFYSDQDGQQIRWPEAPFHGAQASVLDGVSRADAVVATWQTQVILRGGVLTELHPAVPADVRALNDGTANTSTVAVETLAGRSRVAAVFEDRPEIAAYWGTLPGLLTRPAKAGERVRFFVTGFRDGATPSVRLGGRELPSSAFTFAQERPGRIEISLEIPSGTPAGSLAVIVTADGVSTPAGPYLSVSR